MRLVLRVIFLRRVSRLWSAIDIITIRTASSFVADVLHAVAGASPVRRRDVVPIRLGSTVPHHAIYTVLNRVEPSAPPHTTTTVCMPCDYTALGRRGAPFLHLWGPIYKIAHDLSHDYRKFIVRSTYDSDLKRADIFLGNIVS